MGYVKIKKASGYDLLSAENVKLIKLQDGTPPESEEDGELGDPLKVIGVSYMSGGSLTINGAGDFVQADVDKIIAAINIINGSSGPGIFPEDLSQVATSVDATIGKL